MKRILLILLIVLFGALTTACQSITYSVIVTGSKDSLMEPLKSRYKAGETIEIKTYVVTDVSLHVFVNDVQIPMSHYDSDYWGFEFEMPANDIVIHLTFDQFYGEDNYTFEDLYYWLKEIDSNVNKVSIQTIDYSVKDSFVVTKYSTKPEDIASFKLIINQGLIKTSDDESYIISKKYSFYYLDYQNDLEFKNDSLLWYDFSTFQLFEFENENYILPEISNPDLITYSFRYDGLSSDIKKYSDETYSKRYTDINSVEFVPYDGPALDIEPIYYLDSRYGKINLLTDSIFELNGTSYEIISGIEHWASNYTK